MTNICKLCGKTSELKDSHFIPKFVYRALDNAKKKGTNTAIKNEEGRLIPLSKQITSFKLCGDCEIRFSKNGEHFFAKYAYPTKPVLTKINRGEDLSIEDAPPLLKDIASKCKGESSFDVLNSEGEKELVYFVISILWRGSLDWPLYQKINFPQDILDEMKDFLLYDTPLKHLKIFVDLSPHAVFSILKPQEHPILLSCYRFNLLHYMFHIAIVDDNKGKPLSYGKGRGLVNMYIEDIKSLYSKSDKSEKVPQKLSWL